MPYLNSLKGPNRGYLCENVKEINKKRKKKNGCIFFLIETNRDVGINSKVFYADNNTLLAFQKCVKLVFHGSYPLAISMPMFNMTVTKAWHK